MKRLLKKFLCLLALAACMCSPLIGGGSGTNTGNGVIAGMVVTPGNEPGPAVGAKVRLRRDDYVRAPALGLQKIARNNADQLTDKNGRFFIDSLDTGAYCIEVNDGKSNAVLFRAVISTADTLVDLPADTLRPTGTINGTIPVIPGIADVFVQLRGLERLAERDTATGVFVISDVPKGMYTVRIVSLSPDSLKKEINGIAVTSGAETDIGKLDPFLLKGWRFSKTIYFNTTSSGANVSGNVFNFPVIVRLTSSNFDFAGAMSGGNDLRFAKPDNTPLPYEIERWDPLAGLAEVWVRVDTVYGNDSVQSLIMYWGNGNAAAQSSSAAVFDTAAGFAGVWHLGEKSGGLFDATADHYNGARNGNQTQSAGCIGSGQFFKDSGDYTDMGNVCNPDTSGFSVCAWIKPVITKKYQTIVSKSPGGSPSSTYGWLVELDNTGALMTFIATGAGSWGGSRTFVLASAAKIVDSTVWHYVAAVFDRSGNGKCKVYLDGADVSSLPAGGDITNLGAVVNSAPLRLGADANGGCPWKGCMDECSVSLKARSTDWIRLCYMNQKQDDKLTIFR